jgi:hypothetical protein
MSEPNPVIEAAREYVTDSATYMSMRQLGAILGVSSHVVGRKLKEVGLRTTDGKPTQTARDSGFVKTAVMQEGFYFDIWHSEQTLNILRPLIEQPQK